MRVAQARMLFAGLDGVERRPVAEQGLGIPIPAPPLSRKIRELFHNRRLRAASVLP